MPQTLRWKLLLSILPLVALVITAVVWMQYGLSRKQILAAIDKEVHSLADRSAAGIDDLLRQRQHDLFTLAETPLIADYYHNVDFQLLDEAAAYRLELKRYLLRFSRRSGAYPRISYLDASGREVCSVGRVVPSRPGPPPVFTAAKGLAPGSWWVSPIDLLPDGAARLHYAKPVHDETRQLKGVLILCYDLGPVATRLSELKVGKTGKAFLRTPAGAFPTEGGLDRSRPGILQAEAPLTSMPWRLVVEAPLDEFVGPLKRIRDAGTLFACLGIGLLAGIVLLLVASITRPLAALAAAARRIGEGDLTRRIEAVPHGELGVLSAGFNEMAGKLESSRQAASQLQAQLIQSEKLSAIGQLISSVAHELNNPLGAVCGYAQMSMADGVPPAVRRDLEHVHRNALRCRKVVDNLLVFARRSRQERGKVDLNQAARSALELLEYRIKKTEEAVVVQELQEGIPLVIGDFQQVVQVVVNLISNACEAMAQTARQEGKRLVLRTWTDARRVFLAVEDNGPGIAPAARARVFEPFFTTKEPGRGTGLGLTICRQIIEQHGGSISLEAEEGRGTSVTVSLPMPKESELKTLEAPAPAMELAPVPGKKVLVIDDEKDMADIMARALTADGDQVDVTTDGSRALVLVREGAYDLVVSDVQMEKAKGEDVYDLLARRRPDQRPAILFVTGDILNPRVLGFLHRTKAAYLAKPFDVSEFQLAARRLLRQA
ncbi:MAG: response regulator [Elusimicrobia bacterium]|nr:response regulator [Elusimicrobiota bacterium]